MKTSVDRLFVMLILCSGIVYILSGCATASKPLPLQLQSIETKMFNDCEFDTVYNACRTVFMNFGYIVEDCEKESGFIKMGLEVPEKDVALAGLLGVLPGGGSIYTRSYGRAIFSIITYPFSIIWDGPNAMTRAREMTQQIRISVILIKRGGNIEMRMGFRNISHDMEHYGQFMKRFYAEVERKIRLEQNIESFMTQ